MKHERDNRFGRRIFNKLKQEQVDVTQEMRERLWKNILEAKQANQPEPQSNSLHTYKRRKKPSRRKLI